MRTAIPKNNFSSGQIDRELKGRVDLPLYQNGHEISKNFCETIKGTVFYRTGFEFIEEIGDAYLYEFKFNQEQAYLLVFRVQYIEFWSYNTKGEFVRVLDDNGNEYTLPHPYGTQAKNLCLAQNCDVLYITHLYGDYPEYQLKRTASNKFELTKTTFTNSGTKSLDSDSATNNHGFPCTCSFYENRLDRCSSTKYPTYLYGSKGADYNNITVGTGTNDGFQFDLSEANSKALWIVSGANSLLVGTAEGVLTINGGSVSSAITPEDISAKLSCRDGCGAVQPVRKDNFVFFVSANGRKLFMFEYDVLLEQFKATNLSKGNYEITKGGIKKIVYKNDRYDFMYALCNGKILQICFSNDEAVNAWSEFETKGEFLDICTLTRPDGEYDLFAKVKRVINGVTRYYLERLTDYVEFPRFEDYISDIPKVISDRAKLELQKEDKYAFYRSVAEKMRECNHLDCSINYSGLQNTKIVFNPEDETLTLNKSSYLQNIYSGAYSEASLKNGLVCIKLPNKILGVNGSLTDYVAVYSNKVEENTDFKIGANLYKINTKTIFDAKYTNISSNNITINNVKYHRINLPNEITTANGKITQPYLYYTGSLNTNTLLYSLYNGKLVFVAKPSAVNTNNKTLTVKAEVIQLSDKYFMGEVTSLNIDNKTLSIGYYEDSFKVSDVGRRITYKSITGREYGSFDIEEFIDAYKVKVKPLIQPTENSCSAWYLSATVFSGLEHLEGETVSVNGNGGYVGDFVVENGCVDITSANTNKVGSAIIGLKYRGMLKSPNLGVQAEAQQTYTSMKNLYSMILKLSFSAGGKVGDSLYDLDEVQDFDPNGLFDTPPLAMDSDKEILIKGDYDKEKHYYVVQDSPLPFTITMVVPKYKHVYNN